MSLTLVMKNYYTKRNVRGRAPVYLEHDYHSLFRLKLKILMQRVILNGLLFEQFFPSKPGTQLHL